jgi:WD40 repeat protein
MLQDGPVKKVAVSSDGRWIATTGEDHTARVWSSATGTEMLQIPLKGSGSALSFSKDGKYLASGTQTGEINVWGLSSMNAPVNEIQFRGSTGNVQFSQSGDWLAASDKNRVWLLNKEQYSNPITSPQGDPVLDLDSDIKNLAISPDSKWLAVSTEQGDLVIYDIGNRIKRIISLSNSPQKLVFSPDSQQLITGDIEGAVQTRELASGKVIKTLFEAESSVMSLATSSELLAIGLKDKVVILNMNTEQVVDEINSLGDHGIMVFNLQGNLLALSDASGEISIWKQENGEFTLHQSLSRGPVYSMAFNQQGDEILIGGSNLVYLINALTGAEITRIPQKIPANSLSFSPDGKLIATASQKVIQIWELAKIPQIDSDQLVEAACSRMFENLDQAQWNIFFKGEDYKPLCPNLPVP